MNVKIRRLQETDMSLVYSTWLRGLYYGNDFFKKIDKDAFFDIYPKVITKLVADSTAVAACLSDDEDVVIGYAVYQGAILHWVYVKEAFRKQGIATSMLPDSLKVVTHLTKSGDFIRLKKGLKFIPF